jgi:hypothetical protein
VKPLRLIYLSILIVALASCANEPIVQEHMIITPDTIVFAPSVADSTISITHSCSCPFTWNATVSPIADTAWLTFPTYQSGDKSNVPISIKRMLLTADTTIAKIILASNSYGDTTIVVKAIR